MDDIHIDSEILKSIDEYERTVASSFLLSLKEIENIWNDEPETSEEIHPKFPSEPRKSTESNWKTYINSVHKELSKNGTIKIPYSKVIQEASSRKRTNTNVANLNKIRKEKITNNRKVKTIVQTELEPLKDVFKYRLLKLDKSYIGESPMCFKSLEKCISSGLNIFLENFFKYVPYEFFSKENFVTFYKQNIMIEDIKIFTNSLLYTYYDKVYDNSYKDKIEIVDNIFLGKFCLNSLHHFRETINSIFESLNIDAKLVIIKNEIV